MIKNILVFGSGYVGSSLAVLLAERYNVTIIDINKDKVDMVNNRISPIGDKNMDEFLK